MNLEIERLLDLAYRVPSNLRSEILARECSDPAIRAEVESLLKYATTSDTYFEDAVQDLAFAMTSDDLLPGYMVGHYKLVRIIGRGGMGSVYLAERADGEISQKVAIKFLRADLLRKSWRERFLKERELLASLNHPSIVHVLDAGRSSSGRPFLVMEYVDGVDIGEFAGALSVRDRVRLFLNVCEGVSHAHRRLVIHRDLKPSNIIVNEDGQPKLLDFGLAWLLSESQDATQTVERMLTQDYASPEQLAGLPQTTATDVYSLGAVLYRLLTGKPPRNHAERIRRIAITPPSRINSEVRDDFDFIVNKALRDEPEERYASADEFANDLRAALEWRTVQARSGNSWYRTRRFLRRHWLPAAAVIAIVVSLSAGIFEANRQRALAERRFVEVRQLAQRLFDIDEQVAPLPGSLKVRELIVDTSLDYLRRVSSGIQMDPDLTLEVASAYMRVARVQRVSIGKSEQADDSEQRAQTLIDGLLKSRPADRVALLRSSQIAADRMLIARHVRPQDSLRFARKAETQLNGYLAAASREGKLDRSEAEDVILVSLNVGNQYDQAERFDDAIRVGRSTIDFAARTGWTSYQGAALMNLAKAYRATGNLDRALDAVRESVQILSQPGDRPSTGRQLALTSALIAEGQILGEPDSISLDRHQEALDTLDRAANLARELARQDPRDISSRQRIFSAQAIRGNIIRDTDPAHALEMYADALNSVLEMKADQLAHLLDVEVSAAMAEPLRKLGRVAEARRHLDHAFQLLNQMKLYPAAKIPLGSDADDAMRARAEFETALGNAARGSQVCAELLTGISNAGGDTPRTLQDAVSLSSLYRMAAQIDRAAGRDNPAAEMDQRRLSLWREWARSVPGSSFVAAQLRAIEIPVH